jgi:hypothetical protein
MSHTLQTNKQTRRTSRTSQFQLLDNFEGMIQFQNDARGTDAKPALGGVDDDDAGGNSTTTRSREPVSE